MSTDETTSVRPTSYRRPEGPRRPPSRPHPAGCNRLPGRRRAVLLVPGLVGPLRSVSGEVTPCSAAFSLTVLRMLMRSSRPGKETPDCSAWKSCRHCPILRRRALRLGQRMRLEHAAHEGAAATARGRSSSGQQGGRPSAARRRAERTQKAKNAPPRRRRRSPLASDLVEDLGRWRALAMSRSWRPGPQVRHHVYNGRAAVRRRSGAGSTGGSARAHPRSHAPGHLVMGRAGSGRAAGPARGEPAASPSSAAPRAWVEDTWWLVALH